MTTSPGAVRAASSAATTLSGGGGAKRSKTGSCGPRFGRISDESGSAIRGRVYVALEGVADHRADHSCCGRRSSGYRTDQPLSGADDIGRTKENGGPFGPPCSSQRIEELLLLVLVVVVDCLFVDERLVRREVVRHDAADVLYLVVVLVELELVLEIHLLTDERALGVRPQVADLGRSRERDLAVVGGILVRLADDDAHIALADRRDSGRVLVAIGDE